jgi:TolB-like protein
MTARILAYGGRVVDSPGDNLLAEFASVVDAVQCAMDVQQELTTRNAALPPHRRMEFRIGINLGDVIVEDERLYGEGVNIAARVEELAEAGGLCLSGTAYDQVDTKFALDCVFLGEHTVKNIAKPVRVYRVLLEGERQPLCGRLVRGARGYGRLCVVLTVAFGVLLMVGGALAAWRFPWPPPALTPRGVAAKPSVVVLPFVHLSSDPQHEYFSNGLTEELVTALSKYSGLLVMARPAAFAYTDKAVAVQQVGQELGVRYVLTGSIRFAGDTVRITAQLVDTATGYYLWAERYERALTDLFGLQDEITRHIVTALQARLTEGEPACAWPHAIERVDSCTLVLSGRVRTIPKALHRRA